MTDCKVRIAGPTSETMRNTMKQLLMLAGDGELKTIQLQVAAGVIDDCADQVERLETMAVPESQRADTAEIESRKVVMFDEYRPAPGRLALGGAITAPPRRRGLWGRFQTFMRRL